MGNPLEVLIIAPANDPHAAAVEAELNTLQAISYRLDTGDLNTSLRLVESLPGDVTFRLPNGNVLRLMDLRSIWWRRPKRPVLFDENLQPDVSRYVDAEWRACLEAIEWVTDTRIVNRPSANKLAESKTLQLRTGMAAGMRVPKSLITNDKDTVLKLLEHGESTIYKRLGDTPRPLSATRMLMEEDLERLSELNKCPAMFQEFIPAQADLRVTVVGERVYCARIESQIGASTLDWRFDLTVPFSRWELPTKVKEQILTVVHSLQLEYAAIDLRLTPEGDVVFLEVNPNGQYLFVELKVPELRISRSVAELLLS